MPFDVDGELLLWGDSQTPGAVRLRFTDTTTFRVERLQSGTWTPCQFDAGAGGIDLGSVGIESSSGNGAVNGTGVAVGSELLAPIHKTVLTLTDVDVTITDATTAGAHGGLKIYDFPEGLIQILGASMDLTTAAGEGGIQDDAAVVGSLGSVVAQTDNATLTTTEADIIPSTAGTLSSGAGALKGKATSAVAPAVFDGTGTALDMYLNIAMPDAGADDDDVLTVSGTVTVIWANLGDV